MSRRLTDNDKHLGRLTWGKCHDGYRPIGLTISSGDDDEDRGCHLYAQAFGYSARIALPQLIQPHRVKVVAQSWDAATVARMGRNWYYDTSAREYGFRVSDGFLQVFLGRQTNDSSTEQSWCAHLPWTQWRHIRQSWYGPTGQHIETLWDTRDRTVRDAQWEWRREFEASLAKTRFLIEDYDGKQITASTHIEEREWRLGEGLFAWLSLFCKPKVRRSLSIEFSDEVGTEKGSWKGGLIGTSIAMLPGELHESAMRRYCEQEHRGKYGSYRIKFIGVVE